MDKGRQKKRNCGRGDGERRKKFEHLKFLTMPFYFTKIIKNKFKNIVKKEGFMFFKEFFSVLGQGREINDKTILNTNLS